MSPVQSAVAILAASAFGVPTFTKIDAAGTPLPIDADDFAFWRVALGDEAFDLQREDVSTKRMTFAEAERTVADLGDGWRLPTRRELLALVDDTRTNTAANEALALRPNFYWSGTQYASALGYAWLVYFSSGSSDCVDLDFTAFVRAVRSVARAGQ